MLIFAVVSAVFSVLSSIYIYLQMRKAQKKNRIKPEQTDATVVEEGTKFSDIAGSPHMFPFAVEDWGESSKAIRSKVG